MFPLGLVRYNLTLVHRDWILWLSANNNRNMLWGTHHQMDVPPQGAGLQGFWWQICYLKFKTQGADSIEKSVSFWVMRLYQKDLDAARLDLLDQICFSIVTTL